MSKLQVLFIFHVPRHLEHSNLPQTPKELLADVAHTSSSRLAGLE